MIIKNKQEMTPVQRIANAEMTLLKPNLESKKSKIAMARVKNNFAILPNFLYFI